MTKSAEKIFKKIQYLLDEHSESALNFDDELKKSAQLYEDQIKYLETMRAINFQIKKMADSEDTEISQIRQLKNDFTNVFEKYNEAYSGLREILLRMETSYKAEESVIKYYLLKENESILLELIE